MTTIATSTIYKYLLDVDDQVTVRMPEGAEILRVAQAAPDMSSVFLWARVNPNAPHEQRAIGIYGTGHPIPDDPGRHIGTVVGSHLVWHVFESTPEPVGAELAEAEVAA